MSGLETERWKTLAELFLKNNEKAYIRDINDSYYFADILLVGEESLTIQCFGPPQKAGTKVVLYWELITKFGRAEAKE